MTQNTGWDFYEFDGSSEYGHFRTKRLSGVMVLAEKGNESTWEKMPVQAQYRDEQLWAQYKAGQEAIQRSTRQSLVGRRGLKYKISSGSTRTISKMIKKLPASLKKSAPKSLETDLCYVVRSKIKNFRYVGRI